MKKRTLIEKPALWFLVPASPLNKDVLAEDRANGGGMGDIKVASEEGSHYYAFTKDLGQTVGYEVYTKIRATITLPSSEDIDWGPKGRERNAYISLGFANTVNGISVDLGLRNHAGEGWTLCHGGTSVMDAIPGDPIPDDVTTLTLIAEEVENIYDVVSSLRLTAYEGVYDGVSPRKPIGKMDYTPDTYCRWNRIYRFASLMYDQTNNPYNDGSAMKNVQFSNLALYNSKTGKFESWGLYNALNEYVWIVNYPCASFTDKSITATAETFNIDNNWSGPIIVSE